MYPVHPLPPKKERKKERKKRKTDADCSVSTSNTVQLRCGSLSWAGWGKKQNKVTHSGESKTGSASTR
jgi:hypothetical protein